MEKSDHPEPVGGMMPIINSPAHDYDTILAALQNCQNITTQMYTIITFNEHCPTKAERSNYEAIFH